MKNWWLDLYTKPMLKSYFKAYGIVLISTLAISFMMSELLFLALIGGSIYLCVVTMRSSATCLAANMEFHKLHLPYKELRSVWIKNALVQSGVIMASGIIFLVIVSMISPKALGAIGFVLVLPGALSFFTNYFRVVNFKQGGPGPLYEMMDRKFPIKGFFATMSAMTASLFLVIILAIFKVQSSAALSFFPLVFGISYLLFLYKAVFHEEVPKGSVKTYFKYFFKGGVSGIFALVLLMLIASPLSKIDIFDIEIRHEIYSFSGPFAPDLSPMEASELLSVYRPEYSFIFSNTTDIEEVPINQLLKNSNSKAYIYYLETIEKPSLGNLNYILEMVVKKEKMDQFDVIASELVVRKWPKNEKFPEHLLAGKLKAEQIPKDLRLPASDEKPEN